MAAVLKLSKIAGRDIYQISRLFISFNDYLLKRFVRYSLNSLCKLLRNNNWGKVMNVF